MVPILVEGTKQASSITYLYVTQKQFLCENKFYLLQKTHDTGAKSI